MSVVKPGSRYYFYTEVLDILSRSKAVLSVSCFYPIIIYYYYFCILVCFSQVRHVGATVFYFINTHMLHFYLHVDSESISVYLFLLGSPRWGWGVLFHLDTYAKCNFYPHYSLVNLALVLPYHMLIPGYIHEGINRSLLTEHRAILLWQIAVNYQLLFYKHTRSQGSHRIVFRED